MIGSAKQKRGHLGEQDAAKFLKAAGLKILKRNYNTRVGEVDLVAAIGETLVFVEVKVRRNAKFGHASEAVTRTKQRRVIAAAKQYIRDNDAYDKSVRFDVVAIDGDGPQARISWIEHAFDAGTGW